MGLKSFAENTFNCDWSSSLYSLHVSLKPGCRLNKVTELISGYEKDVFSGWWLWWEVKSMWWTWDGPSTQDWMKHCSEGRVHLSQLPVVWLSFSLSDCLPALMQAQVLPPFLHEMPCVLECTRCSEPVLDTQGATSVPPGRCLFHTHLSPGSQKSLLLFQLQCCGWCMPTQEMTGRRRRCWQPC